MKRLLILFILVGFFFAGGCITTYNPSPEQLKQNRLEYKQYERDNTHQNILRELKKLNRRK